MTAFAAVPVLLLLLLTTLLSLTTSHVLHRTNLPYQNKKPEFSLRQQSLPGGNIACSCAQGPRKRYEFRSLPKANFTAFVNAFKKLKNTADGNSIFEQFTRLHLDNSEEAHGSPQFLPWHREMLFQLECRLRQIDPYVTIPYWDWSVDSEHPESSPLWGLIGGARSGQSIPNEPFKKWSSAVILQHDVIRNFDANVDGSGFSWPLESEGSVRNLQNDGSLWFHEFSNALEINYHNGPHAGVGGDMGDYRSPNDPVFYLHHAFVDKIWSEWQKLPEKKREYNGRHKGRVVTFSDTPSPWGVTIRNMFQRDSCVTYEQHKFVESSSAGKGTLKRHQSSIENPAIREAGSSGNGENDEDSEPLPTNLPRGLEGKAKKSANVREALKEADENEIKKLSESKPGRVEAIAKRIIKNHGMEEWARKNGYPPEKIKEAKKIAAKEDPSVNYNEIEDGKPPGE